MFSRAFLAVILTLFFLIDIAIGFTQSAKGEISEKPNGRIFSLIEDRLEIKVGQYVNTFTRYLEDFNDRHLGVTDFGRFLHYDEMKPKLGSESGRAGSMKKMAMAMMPLVFHIGAASTWMVLTSIMAAKGVLIGLMLLVFKIAVSSAKLASFFTQLKSKHDDHHSWSWSPPHHEYHGHDRSFSNEEHAPPHDVTVHHSPEHSLSSDHHSDDHPSSDWNSYSPEWTPNDIQTDYHTSPVYKNADSDDDYSGPYLNAEDRKKVVEKKKFKK